MRALSSMPYILSQLLVGRCYGAILLYTSHKLLRWLLWLPASALLLSCLWLAPSHVAFAYAALLKSLLYASVPIVLSAARAGRQVPLLTHWAFFVLSMIAMAQAFCFWAAGRKKATWRLREIAAT
jgi:hypothetical protein